MSKDKIMAKVIELAEKRDALELSKDEIELGLIDDIKKIQSEYIKKSQSAVKSVSSALSDLADSTAAIEKGIKITDDAIKKAKELGADSFVKRGEGLKGRFEKSLSSHRKALSDLRSAKGLIV